MDIIKLEDIHYTYPGRPQVLSGVDFTLRAGGRVGIMGPNGTGKSTLLKIAMGLIRPSRGKITALGEERSTEKDFRPLRRKIGFLFQDPEDQLFCPTVEEDVAFGPMNLGKGKQRALELVGETLGKMGLSGYESRVTYQLSGGEKRLVSLAAVLAMEPWALLLDEPNSGLDAKHSRRLEQVLLDSDLSWAIVSHDQELLQRTCNQIIALRDGSLKPL